MEDTNVTIRTIETKLKSPRHVDFVDIKDQIREELDFFKDKRY
jgi:hypothetical protein